MTDDELKEAFARALTAKVMGLINDPKGARLPYDLWRHGEVKARIALAVVKPELDRLRQELHDAQQAASVEAAERRRLQGELHTVLDREAATIKRHDEKFDVLETEIDRLPAELKQREKYDEILEELRRRPTQYAPAVGCVCPPGAEAGCGGTLCPRKPMRVMGGTFI